MPQLSFTFVFIIQQTDFERGPDPQELSLAEETDDYKIFHANVTGVTKGPVEGPVGAGRQSGKPPGGGRVCTELWSDGPAGSGAIGGVNGGHRAPGSSSTLANMSLLGALVFSFVKWGDNSCLAHFPCRYEVQMRWWP